MKVPTLNFKKINVLTVGDVMLDQYWHGGTSRISPEAPVPVVQVNRMDERPGGAGNVAIGVGALGANVALLGLVGTDMAADTLETLLLQRGIACQLERLPKHKTITKLRIMSRNQQMVRIDMEEPFAQHAEKEIQALYSRYEAALDTSDIVILSDYGKGTLVNAVELIALANQRQIPVVVDPKSQDFSMYRGATVLTPNLKEFEAAVGKCESTEILVEKAFAVLKEHNIGSLLITRSEKGVTTISADGTVTHLPAVAREVHDVTGAGDTVVAALSVGIASGFTLSQAANLGNIAAGIVVGKLGAATVTAHELELALGEDQNVPLGVMPECELLAAINVSRARGEKIVFTNGCFDILHAGHVMYLEQAKKLGDRLVVAVNDDASVSRLKGSDRPINILENRMSVLCGLKAVDWVVSFSENTPQRLIEAISPNVLTKGGDYEDTSVLPGAAYVQSQGGEVRVLGLKEGCSTSQLIETILLDQNVVSE